MSLFASLIQLRVTFCESSVLAANVEAVVSTKSWAVLIPSALSCSALFGPMPLISVMLIGGASVVFGGGVVGGVGVSDAGFDGGGSGGGANIISSGLIR